MKKRTGIFGALTFSLAAFGQTGPAAEAVFSNIERLEDRSMQEQPGILETATFGAGCFWCVEAVFQRLRGVESVRSGYSGGKVRDPAYREVTTGRTGHAEVIQLTYDPAVITYDELLEVFWQTHDPTTMNRQGADVGTQYRSVIFCHNEEQCSKARHYRQQLNAEGVFPDPIVTEISEFKSFYAAEDYHQNYYNLNKSQSYCTYVINPKVEKLKKVFADKLKEEYR